MKKYIKFLFIFFILLNTAFSQQDNTYTVTSAMFGELKARQIGPAVMSGRITYIDAVNKDPRILYVGAAGGGVWKSINGGAVFKSVFDKYTQSIGAITIDQFYPNIVWGWHGQINLQ